MGNGNSNKKSKGILPPISVEYFLTRSGSIESLDLPQVRQHGHGQRHPQYSVKTEVIRYEVEKMIKIRV